MTDKIKYDKLDVDINPIHIVDEDIVEVILGSDVVMGEIRDGYDTKSVNTLDLRSIYAHYAAVGIHGGANGLILPFCVYHFKSTGNICTNAVAIVLLPWSFKVLYAIMTDAYRPMGLRRKPYIIAGWIGVLFFTFLLSLTTGLQIGGTELWLSLSLLLNACLMLADVPADGYSVEIGKLELEHERGQILATGQRVRFIASMFMAVVQTLLVNGPTTNPPQCPMEVQGCWPWGLTVSQFYGVVLVLNLILFYPISAMKESIGLDIPHRSLREHAHTLWKTMQNPTTLYLLIYVIGTQVFSTLGNMTAAYMQFYVIGLNNLQSGVDSLTTSLALVISVGIFQRYLINKNWRSTQYMSSILTSVLGIQWLLVYYNIGGLRDGWFTIFINTNQEFAAALTQVLSAMVMIEIAQPGQEATTFEVVVSVNNAAMTVSSVLSSQLLAPMHSLACELTDATACPPYTVAVHSVESYLSTHGPARFSSYAYLILAINFMGTLIFTPFLPRQKAECREWAELTNSDFGRKRAWTIGVCSVALAGVTILYGITASILLLNPATSCLQIIGGSGC